MKTIMIFSALILQLNCVLIFISSNFYFYWKKIGGKFLVAAMGHHTPTHEETNRIHASKAAHFEPTNGIIYNLEYSTS